MATLTELKARLEDLKKKRDSGVLTTRHADVMVTFRSLAEMNSAISSLEQEISNLESKPLRRVRKSYQPRKGL